MQGDYFQEKNSFSQIFLLDFILKLLHYNIFKKFILFINHIFYQVNKDIENIDIVIIKMVHFSTVAILVLKLKLYKKTIDNLKLIVLTKINLSDLL